LTVATPSVETYILQKSHDNHWINIGKVPLESITLLSLQDKKLQDLDLETLDMYEPNNNTSFSNLDLADLP
jgi:hypothetical protein